MNDRPLRILLVRPHACLAVSKHLQNFLLLEPLELEIVAGGVPDEDHVSICDLSLEKKPIKTFQAQLEEKKPHIIGLTGYSNQAAMVRKLAQMAKSYDPSVITVVGGIHATIVPSDYSSDDIDIVVRGEGGVAFREIVKRFKNSEPLSFGDAALSPKAPDFHEKASQQPPKFPQVDDIPPPRRDLVQRSRYFTIWTSAEQKKVATLFPRMASVRTSYGCKYTCSFCVVPYIMRSEYIQRSPEDVVDEIERLKEDHIYFVDDETFINAKRMTEIANLLLERGIKKKYVSWARSDTIARHPEMFRLWEKAGLRIIFVGLEAMDNSRLDNYKKRTTIDTNLQAISILRELGITIHAALMVDPDFSEEDFLRLEEAIGDIGPAEFSFTVFSPSPGTELWHKNKDKFICDPYLYYDCFHTILPTKLEMKKFYQHFARLYIIGWKASPIRVNRVRAPFREIIRSISSGVKYVIALKKIYLDY